MARTSKKHSNSEKRCLVDPEKEKLVLKKVNERLMKFNTEYTLRWIGSDENHVWSNIEICDGECLGRRHWDNMLQLVNALDYSTVVRDIGQYATIMKMYKAFYGLASKSLDELLVKLDLADIYV